MKKNCPRCKTGQIARDRDNYGVYDFCLQCGYQKDVVIVDPTSGIKGDYTDGHLPLELLHKVEVMPPHIKHTHRLFRSRRIK